MSTVSYLVPSYNHAPYLLNLLDSIEADIKQLRIPAEVILIDDGSTDDSPTLIASWAQKEARAFPVHYFVQKNQGIARVLNQLLHHARGDYVRLCASDDAIIPGSTQTLYDAMFQNPHYLCVMGDAQIIDQNGLVIHSSSIAFHGGRVNKLADPEQLTRELIQHWCIAGPSHLIKKNHYKSMSYKKEQMDDYHLFLSLLEHPHAVKFINQTVCLYRLHLANTSKTKNPEKRIANLQSFLAVINQYIERKTLKAYLLPVQYKTLAKINYLQKKYLSCGFFLLQSLFFKIKIHWILKRSRQPALENQSN